MLDFLDEDWFIISLEIVFVILIVYDIKKYIETKKKEYITNIVLTFGFAIWTLLPFYNSYVTWADEAKQEFTSICEKENNETLCSCLSDNTFKEYNFVEFTALDKSSTDYKEFIKESKEECLDDSWF
ncbi:MAG: hypothetical protein KAR81_02580 [Sulfurimonas sp.]|nr:hypothetical protein [Sulfurimonas sp.]